MKVIKSMSTEALVAKMIRGELKEAFPKCKFRVVCGVGGGTSSVNVTWLDGPDEDMVSKITDKYQYGHFDAMYDICEHSNCRSDIPQVRYTFVQRDISTALCQEVFDITKSIDCNLFGLESLESPLKFEDKTNKFKVARHYVGRRLDQMDLTNGFDLEGYKKLIDNKSIYYQR